MSTREEASTFSGKIEDQIPGTSQIIRFCEIFNKSELSEKWEAIWRVAILRSLASFLLHKRYFSQYMDSNRRTRIVDNFSQYISQTDRPRGIYAELRTLLNLVSTQHKFDQLVNDSRWNDLEDELNDILKTCPPVFFYLDSEDKYFENAPMEWHRCQLGLFHCIMALLRQDKILSSRLHVIITVRDLVFSSAQRSEHAGKFRDVPHVCKLTWDTDRIAHFLNGKLQTLPYHFFDDPRKPKTVENFLGLTKIRNARRGIEESLASYIIRHTRNVPRDIVEIGNKMAQAKLLRRRHGYYPTQDQWEDRLRRIVAQLSRQWAEEQLRICGNQLLSHDKPAFAAYHNYEDYYTTNQEYLDTKSALLKQVITTVGSEKFSYGDVEAVRDLFSDELPSGVDAFTILWQNGLIGCQFKDDAPNGRFRFYSLDDREDFLLPEHARSYAFHSSLIDATSLSAADDRPVIAGSIL